MSKKNFKNATHIEGYLYQHELTSKTTGDKSKNPGTVYISGTVEIATDSTLTNVIPVNFTYVTPKTGKGNDNPTFKILNDIINGTIGSVMGHGIDKAGKLRIDSSIGLNEFYSDRNGQEELVSVKRNDGGFVHLVNELNPDETTHNTFDVDMIITGTRMLEADEDKGLEEKMILKGAIFDFRKSLLPIELSVINPRAIAYFESMEISGTNPLCTNVRGLQISEIVKVTKTEEGAWGEPIIREYTNTRKDYVITWAATEPYEWDSEEFITGTELKEAMAAREVMLAGIKQRRVEYLASKNGGAAAAPVSNSGFNF